MHLLTDSDLNGLPKTLINRKQLLKIIPLSERTILDMEKRGEFPRRFALTARNVAWDLDEIRQWIQQRKERANAGYPRGLGLS
ncbi:MAG: AlpA family phage regulatory protein [Rhodocyclaceae bacterium]|jgi:prophage regulatory protein|nr:AlpA family phage regulatory protein [Rhodocyclaceae bacterium]